jgi:hypothetical protein
MRTTLAYTGAPSLAFLCESRVRDLIRFDQARGRADRGGLDEKITAANWSLYLASPVLLFRGKLITLRKT